MTAPLSGHELAAWSGELRVRLKQDGLPAGPHDMGNGRTLTNVGRKVAVMLDEAASFAFLSLEVKLEPHIAARRWMLTDSLRRLRARLGK